MHSDWVHVIGDNYWSIYFAFINTYTTTSSFFTDASPDLYSVAHLDQWYDTFPSTLSVYKAPMNQPQTLIIYLWWPGLFKLIVMIEQWQRVFSGISHCNSLSTSTCYQSVNVISWRTSTGFDCLTCTTTTWSVSYSWVYRYIQIIMSVSTVFSHDISSC